MTFSSLRPRNWPVWMVCTLTCVGTSCDRSKEQTQSAPATNSTTRARPVELAPDAAAALQPFIGQGKPETEADLAWKKLEEGADLPEFPAEWLVQRPSPEELSKFQATRAEQMVKVADAAKDFYTRFPTNEHAIEARQREYELLSRAVEQGQTNRLAQLTAAENALIEDVKVPEDARVQMRLARLMRNFSKDHESNASSAVATLEKGVRALQAAYPKREDLAGLMVEVAGLWLDVPEPEKAKALANEVAASAVPEEIKASAQTLLKRIARLGQPLLIKFKAVDGREVDLQAMKGKVVLVDFWATWCGPCMEELPNVKAAYEKLRGRGFEIVGISFDQDKEALERVVNQEKMTWPQYFEEGASDNKYGEEFQIDGIPTMWLVDKKGLLRHLNAREDLTAKVEKLLAE